MKKRILSILMVLPLMFACVLSFTSCKKNDGTLEYYLIKPQKSYYDVRGIKDKDATDIVVPAEFDGKPVYAIGPRGFEESTIVKSVVISEGVEYIDDHAFINCTSLSNITIPVSVTGIDSNAFDGCISLTQINYNGTKSQWNQLTGRQNLYSGLEGQVYTIKCSDGNIHSSEVNQ